ncbi:MAG: hypothetical protein L3K02_05145 [Thermoplasmata archaeon]|nr:hypothetical protein [Thermoplasmata archaeon]
MKGTRLTASTLLLIATLLLAASMAVSWWGASISGGGHATVIGFAPGSSYNAQGGFNGTVQQTYISAGLVHVGELYEAVLGIGLVATIAGLVSVVLSYLGAFASFKTRRTIPLSLLITLISLASAATLPILVALGQPGAFNADNTSGFGSAACGPSPNPCTAFWGSISAGGSTVSWGADVGWYLAVAAAVLLLVAFIQLWSVRNAPYARDEVRAASAYMAALPSGSSAPPPTSSMGSATPATLSGAPSTTASYCPRCGNPMTYVSQYSRWYCMTERVYL